MPRTGTTAPPRPADPIDDLTPAMRQYAEQKRQVGDALLLFRMGDFYETFYEDAKTCARVLGIALTSRTKGENPIPLAGIPHFALTSYLRRLVKAGFRVAISEQVEDPKTAKGVIRREVLRIVTAGTLTDDSLLDEKSDNILMAACPRGARVGWAKIELASGRFEALSPRDPGSIDDLLRLRPAELLVNEELLDQPDGAGFRPVLSQLQSICGTAITRRAPFEFGEHRAHRQLCEHFGVTSLAGFGLESMDESLCAAGAILAYLRETQRASLGHVTRITRPTSGRHLLIDHNSWRSLEVERTLRGDRREGSLLHAIDRTVHALGSRKLRHWLAAPILDIAEINSRQEAVASLIESGDSRDRVRKILRSMADVERITSRMVLGRASPRDLAAMSFALSALPSLRYEIDTLDAVPPLLRGEQGASELEDAPPTGFPQPLLSKKGSLLAELRGGLDGLDDLAGALRVAIRSDSPPTLKDGGVILDGFDADLDRLRAIGHDGQAWLSDYQKQQIEASGINGLKVGFNRIFGYYIEISRAHRGEVPANYVRRQTVKNAERYITDELKRYETEVLTALERAIARETTLFEQLRALAASRVRDLQRVAEAIGLLDVLVALAELAVEQRYVRPTFTNDGLRIVAGRHPVLDQVLAGEFVPNDTEMDAAARALLITGPNMAGKSTYIRQVALLTLMAQIGSSVPAESMSLVPADRLFARVGSADEISRGQSTFMVEMTEAANILNNATARSLVILDEIGRGTSTFDGLSLAWAITEHLAQTVRCRTLVATHYHELTELADLHEGIRNFSVAVREWTPADGQEPGIIFLHRIVPGATDKSYGMHVARLAGVPPTVVTRSREVLKDLERGPLGEARAVKAAGTAESNHKQLSLFNDPADAITRELSRLDINQLTPVQALLVLKSLQDRLNNGV